MELLAIITYSIYANDTTIYSCLNIKPDQFNKGKLTADLKSDLQSVVNWGKQWLVKFNTSKVALF